VVVLAEKKAGGGRGRASGSSTSLKELGEHPVTGKPVRVLAGRYGPYIKHEAINANVPKGADPQALTLEAAVALLDAREAQGGGKKKPARRAAKAAQAAGAKASTAKPKKASDAKKKTSAKAKKPAAKAPARKKA
jgi:DNA topoisomerase-1